MNKYIFLLIGVLSMLAFSCSNDKEKTHTVIFVPDVSSNLNNPYMGWTLYSEGKGWHTDGKQYWEQQDSAAREYAGVFYLRWKWSELEPSEGAYAWERDSVFMNLIQGALDRNLRLAFRAFVHTGTPQYVLDGARTYEHWGVQTPYADDEFFIEKYSRFIQAFGKKFNDPTTVDYVDSYGMGWWGEGHNIKYQDPSKNHESHNRIVKAYAKAFNKVINVVNYGVRDEVQQKVVYDELGFSARRDGYASKWFPEKDQHKFVSHFPQTPIIAEACYWGNKEISYHKESEGKIIWNSWADYYNDVVDLALKTNANYLDMRTTYETRRYMQEAPDQARRFLRHGGYRIYPDSVNISYGKGKLNLRHSWTNMGVGVLPNNNKNLGYKYKVAFALFDSKHNMVQQWVSDQVEVSQLVNGKSIVANDVFDIPKVGGGKHKLGVAIINTKKNDAKDITLAVKDAEIIVGEWLLVSDKL